MRLFLTVFATLLYCSASALFYFLEEMWARSVLGPPNRFLYIADTALQPWLGLLDWLPYRIPFFVDWYSAPMASTIRLEICSALIWSLLVFALRRFRIVCYTIMSVTTSAALILITFGIRDYRHASYLYEHYGPEAPPAEIHKWPVEEKPAYIKKLEEWDVKKP